MAELAGVNRFPLTGGMVEVLDQAIVTPVGIRGDRELVLFDETIDPDIANNRVSEKQLPKIMTLMAMYQDGLAGKQDNANVPGTIEITFPDSTSVTSRPDAQDGIWMVTEFGDFTLCTYNSYDEIAPPGQLSVTQALRDYLGHESIRLARKSKSWQRGEYIKPENRANAPLHIITQASFEEFKSNAENPEFSADRFRANLLLTGDFEPYEEQQWVGRVLRIGEVLIKISRGTPRCPVPGYNPLTGKNMGDVPALYKNLPRVEGSKKHFFGVYGYPLLGKGETAEIGFGDKVELV